MEAFKDLGITFDTKLSFLPRIENVIGFLRASWSTQLFSVIFVDVVLKTAGTAL